MLLEFTFPAEQEEYCFLTKTVDEETCNPLKVWHDMGEPANLSEEQTKLIRESSRPFVKQSVKAGGWKYLRRASCKRKRCGLFRTECRKGESGSRI